MKNSQQWKVMEQEFELWRNRFISMKATRRLSFDHWYGLLTTDLVDLLDPYIWEENQQ